MGEGPVEGTGKDEEVKGREVKVVGSGCGEGPLLGVRGVWGVGCTKG